MSEIAAPPVPPVPAAPPVVVTVPAAPAVNWPLVLLLAAIALVLFVQLRRPRTKVE